MVSTMCQRNNTWMIKRYDFWEINWKILCILKWLKEWHDMISLHPWHWHNTYQWTQCFPWHPRQWCECWAAGEWRTHSQGLPCLPLMPHLSSWCCWDTRTWISRPHNHGSLCPRHHWHCWHGQSEGAETAVVAERQLKFFYTQICDFHQRNQ